MTTVLKERVFDLEGMYDALDAERTHRGMGWFELADELWEQSAALNAERQDPRICGGAVKRLRRTGTTSCQYALFMLRWLGRPPEDFLIGPGAPVGDTTLPEVGPEHRLRWDLARLHAALDEDRRRRGLTWASLASELGVTPARLTNLRTARTADMDLTMRVTQALGRPASAFVHAARW